ncbi:ankyrin repeat domain-containing protein [Candidatus Dependentiae bacterium]|nr:ankyrin repeat domain-containing protein [Candidatus Dependentiae bacterium]
MLKKLLIAFIISSNLFAMEFVNSKQQTPLMLTCLKGQTDVAKSLIEQGVELNEIDNEGATALMLAIRSQHFDIAKLLIDSGANIHIKDKAGITALMWASMGGSTDIVQLLIDKGANALDQDNNGQTATSWAKHFNFNNKNKQVIEMLLLVSIPFHEQPAVEKNIEASMFQKSCSMM